MKLTKIVAFLIIALLLASCSSATSTQGNNGETQVVGTTEIIPQPTQPPSPTQVQAPMPTSGSITYPAPAISSAVPTTSAYPAPGQSGQSTSGIPASGYEPQPGDDSLTKDKVTIDGTTSKVVVTASEPAQAKAVLTGTMSDPCHNLRAVVTPADANNTINIDVYSLFDSSSACVTKEEPFTASIPLGSYASGDYTVNVNGAKLGTFQTVFTPQPGDDKLTKGDATVDMKASRVVTSATQAGSASVDLKGTMPDPCHQLRIVLTPADTQKNIKLDVYSVFDSKKACVTVIQPFEVIFPLGSFTTGQYSIYINGELLGKLNIQ